LHLLITDIYLPRLSGDELAQRLLELRAETKVLFLSGYRDGVIVGHNLIGPKSAFLHMPFGHPDLIDQIQALIEGTGAAWRDGKPSLKGVLEAILQSP
jgi:FixJ family two-component response regulator